MPTTTLPAITPESRIGDLVAACPSLARVFEELRLDYCCGGKQSLAAASDSRGLSVLTVIGLLEAATAALAAGPAEVNAATLSLSQLADHIEQSHHRYLKAELPRLVEMSARVATKHGWRDARLAELAATVQDLASDMLAHMQKEEVVLFPLVRQIDAGVRGGFHASIAEPIACMEAEHADAGRALERLRELTDGFAPDADACNTHRAMLAGLAQLEADLHHHVHKENNVLFPRALARIAG
ncbi:Iron-sulfur cluster repair protein YtfE [Lacunisphaera limnophila]|uniref:Iron-sulfur cluster repair protein YtfE n=1 Tax=Lacunisphaera limnophila TaxID=1838286 RepID=A0A1I7PI50_9BACT|nr:iron-sulfur cluster repair di-iron protein [Lacunisphaera limnophila]AOS43307.1 Iron-sulfur cluster repair protein YtfE [Lacunisphaera limnophila]